METTIQVGLKRFMQKYTDLTQRSQEEEEVYVQLFLGRFFEIKQDFKRGINFTSQQGGISFKTGVRDGGAREDLAHQAEEKEHVLGIWSTKSTFLWRQVKTFFWRHHGLW